MRALAQRRTSPTNHDAYLLQGNAAAMLPAAPRGATPPAETDAWWLSRSQMATFAQRRLVLSNACARALRAAGGAPGRIVVEFNGARFAGAALAANDGRYELDLGDALAQEMADVLDEDDGLDIELVTGRSQPTLAIHPYLLATRREPCAR